jgi:hypothetical protein
MYYVNIGKHNMQIPSIPPPILTSNIQQDVVAKAVPNIQAAPPLLQRAIDPPPKSEKFNQTRSNRDRSQGGDSDPDDRGPDDKGSDDRDGDDKRGSSVNIRV